MEQHRTRAADGRMYIAMEWQPFPDRRFAIGRVRQGSMFVESVDVIADDHGEGWGVVFRPLGVEARDGLFLHLQRDGSLAVLDATTTSDVRSHFAVALDGAAWGTVDPFVLFGEDDVGDDAQLDEQCESVLRSGRLVTLQPAVIENMPWPQELPLSFVREAREHPSRWVRDAAAKLLAAHAEWTSARMELR